MLDKIINEFYAKNELKKSDDNYIVNDDTQVGIEFAFEQMTNKATKTDVWILPSDELPPLGELVMVRKKPTGNVVAFDNICDTGGWLHNSYADNPKKHDVMYWMRIPKCPLING